MLQNQRAPQVTCNYKDHSDQYVSAICTRNECKKQSALCQKCMLPFHKQCEDQITYLGDLPNQINNFKGMIESIDQILESLIKQLRAVQYSIMKPVQIDEEIQNMANLNTLGQLFRTKQRINLDSIQYISEQITQMIQTCLCPLVLNENFQQQESRTEEVGRSNIKALNNLNQQQCEYIEKNETLLNQELTTQQTQNPMIEIFNNNLFNRIFSGQPKNYQSDRNQTLVIEKVKFLDHCDCYKLNNQDIYFVLSKFTLYTGQFNIETSQKQGKGLILIRYFDKNLNTSYFHYEGEFMNVVGRGKLFQQKSKLIQMEEEWSSIQSKLNRYPQIKINPHKNDQKSIRSKRIFYSDDKNVFYDQLLNLRDQQILVKNSTSWLNSSIIDAYVEHLNHQDELKYWALSKEDRQQYKRLYIVPSWLFSWFQINEDQKNFELFKSMFQQFEPIKYKFQEIYKKVGFIINSSNTHWYFAQLDFEKKEILFKDSMRGAHVRYNSTKAILQHLFNNINEEKHQFTLKVCQECKKQENTYDCGAYTCLNAKEFAEGKQQDIKTETEMRQFLLDFIEYTFQE